MRRKPALSRRDFLKLASALPAGMLVRSLERLPARVPSQGAAPNVLVFVFDAWSADHVRFYGYPRNTMPNLEKFAERATVFHNHYSAATFTVPGTSSLLTGLHPWTHRGLNLSGAGMADRRAEQQFFSVFSDTHFTQAFTQNKFADAILFQCEKHIDHHLPAGAFNLEHRFMYNLPFFQNDAGVAFAAFDGDLIRDGGGQSSGLFSNPAYRVLQTFARQWKGDEYKDRYPRGLPDDTEQFLLSDVVDGAIESLRGLPEPFFSYFHVYPPHENYRQTTPFYGLFDDGWEPPEKPIHPMAWARYPQSFLNEERRNYDEYLASWDAQAGRLFDFLHASGLFDRSYIVITADHGELFERGEKGHFTPLLYDPLVHVPLIISRPGQMQREDIRAFTSSVDVLPTLAHAAGKPVPHWAEGRLLPGLGGEDDPGRSLFSMDAKENAAFAPLAKLTLALTKNQQRLVLYRYPADEHFEFYDLAGDPEELKDLYAAQPSAAHEMEQELLDKLDEVNQAFEAE